MSEDEFVAYVGIADIHDGTVIRVSVEGKIAEVLIVGYSGSEHAIFFEGVDQLEMKEPEGMFLYSLSEMRAEPPLRKFVFVNSEENNEKSLSIVALDLHDRLN
jgi:creatinine amidohydrolase/Fe(II)-dependent formamide hydrolase-like protein